MPMGVKYKYGTEPMDRRSWISQNLLRVEHGSNLKVDISSLQTLVRLRYGMYSTGTPSWSFRIPLRVGHGRYRPMDNTLPLPAGITVYRCGIPSQAARCRSIGGTLPLSRSWCGPQTTSISPLQARMERSKYAMR